MKLNLSFVFAIAASTALLVGCSGGGENPHAGGHHGGDREQNKLSEDGVTYEKEVHLSNMHQFTFGGDNAEAYWSFESNSLVFQTSNPKGGIQCDQIFVMNVDEDGTPSETPPARTRSSATC